MKKYEFTGETKQIINNGKTIVLHKIKTIIPLKNVKSGTIGGWIEREENLSHDGDAWVFDNAQISGNARVFDNARISDNARIYDNAWIFGNARVSNTWAYSDARISAQVFGNAQVFDNAQISNNAQVFGNAQISNNAQVYSSKHVLLVGPIGSRNDYTTFYRTEDNKIAVSCGCFIGSIDDFEKQVKEVHGESIHAIVYKKAIELAKLHIGLE